MKSNGFLKTLKELEDTMEEAWNVPFAKNRLLIEEDKIRNLIEELRMSLPIEMRKAQEVLDTKEKIISKAQTESDSMLDRARKSSETMLSKARKNAAEIIAEAKTESEQLINEQAILAIAKERADEIVERAKNDSVKMRNVTVKYIDGIVNDTYKSLERAMNSVEQLKDTYSNDNKENK